MHSNFRSIVLLMMVFTILGPFKKIDAQNGIAIAIGTSYNFSQDQKTTVRYTFTTAYPAEFSLKIGNWESTLNWSADYDRIYILNDTLGYIGRNDQSSVSNQFLFHMFESKDSLVFRLGDAGTYHIDLHSGQADSGWGGKTSQSYTMQLLARYRADAHESNDRLEDAAPIIIGETVTAYQWKKVKLHNVGGDEDWYKFTLDSPGELTINLSNWVATQNWSTDFDRLYVLNGQGTVIGSTNADPYYAHMMAGGTTESPKVIKMNLSQGGSYYIRLHSGVGISNRSYSFTTTFKPANDLFEPNDTFASSKLIEQSETWQQAWQWRSLDYTMNVKGDEDYYHFWAAAAGTYGLTLKGWIATLNWSADYDRLYIYDGLGNSIGSSPYRSMLYSFPINFSVPAAGKYVLRLHSGIGYSIAGYEFKITGLITNVNETSIQPIQQLLYPNPTEGSITIQSKDFQEKAATLTIYTTSGTMVMLTTLWSDKQKIDLRHLPDGLYLAEIKTDNWTKHEKFIIRGN